MKTKRLDDLHILDKKTGRVVTDKWYKSIREGDDHNCMDNLNPGGYCTICGSGRDFS